MLGGHHHATPHATPMPRPCAGERGERARARGRDGARARVQRRRAGRAAGRGLTLTLTLALALTLTLTLTLTRSRCNTERFRNFVRREDDATGDCELDEEMAELKTALKEKCGLIYSVYA